MGSAVRLYDQGSPRWQRWCVPVSMAAGTLACTAFLFLFDSDELLQAMVGIPLGAIVLGAWAFARSAPATDGATTEPQLRSTPKTLSRIIAITALRLLQYIMLSFPLGALLMIMIASLTELHGFSFFEWFVSAIESGRQASSLQIMDHDLKELAQWAAIMAVWCFPAAATGAVMGYTSRSVIATLGLAPVVCFFTHNMMTLPHLAALLRNDSPQDANPWSLWGWFIFKHALATLLLLGWMWYILRRSRLHELKPAGRLAYATVFGAAAVEVSYVLFWADWRDVIFLVFGI